MDSRSIIEAILFVTETPVPEAELAELLELPVAEVGRLLDDLGADLDRRGSGLCLRQAGGGWRLYTRAEAFPYLERFSSSPTARRLSAASLEVLAVIAYRQPVSRGQVTEIRGVDSESAIHTLERLGLVEEAGRLPSPGNPAVYRTTSLLLEKLGINSLEELPPLADHVPPSGVVEVLEESFRTP